jgi:hypothetical protein
MGAQIEVLLEMLLDDSFFCRNLGRAAKACGLAGVGWEPNRPSLSHSKKILL